MIDRADSSLVPRPSLILRTLGSAGLWLAGDGEPRLGPGKPFAMLTYLALTPDRLMLISDEANTGPAVLTVYRRQE